MASEAESRFVFEDVAAPPVPSLLRGFSAPVRLMDVPHERLRFLARHDTDPFVRWDSGQQYATAVLLDLAAAWRAGGALTLDPGLLEAVAATLASADADPEFAAEALTLPGENVLADAMAVADTEAVHAAREFARAAIGRALGAALRETYARNEEAGEYRIDGASIGRRALKNTALAYLAAAGAEGIALARAQFDAQRNMTDVLAALAVLARTENAARDAALAAFHARWRGDDLVLDKWFAIQAIAPLPGHARGGARADAAPGFRPAQPEPRARAGGRVHGRQSGVFPCRVGRGLRFPGRAGDRRSTRATARSRRGWWPRSAAGGGRTRHGRR